MKMLQTIRFTPQSLQLFASLSLDNELNICYLFSMPDCLFLLEVGVDLS